MSASITFNPTAEGITWKTVSIYEFEVYGEKQSSGSEVWDALNNLTVKAGDKKLNLPTVEGGKVEAYADYEQIIDTDGTIYQPLEDKTVSVEFKVTDQNNKVTKKEIAITVPGTHTATADENAKTCRSSGTGRVGRCYRQFHHLEKLTHRDQCC